MNSSSPGGGGDPRTVSVVVPTFQKVDLLSTTLEALTGQTYPAGALEVVVVDDCSGDDTGAFLEGLDPPYRLTVETHAVNRGRAAARNTGIRAASGDLVVFLDDDMRAEPDLVAEHVAFHERHPGSAVIGNALTAPELGQSNVYSYLDTRGVHKLAPGDRAPARYFLTNNSSVPRTALLAAGLFDDSFASYGFEDMEIAYRLEREAGLRFWYCSAAVAYHIHSHTLDELLAKRLEGARSSLPLLLRKFPEKASDLSVDALLPSSPSDPTALRMKKALVALATAPPFLALARAVARAEFLGAASRPFIDLLVAASYREGLRLAAEDSAGHSASA